MINSRLSIKFYIFYYLVLFAIFVLWPGVDYQPPLILRLAFVSAIFLPAFSVDERMVPIFITLFQSLCWYGFPYSFMPTNSYIYVIISFIGFLLLNNKTETRNAVPLCYWLLMFLVSIVNFIQSGTIEGITFSLLIFILTYSMYDFTDYKYTQLLKMAFVILSIVLSIKFIFFGSLYEVDVYKDSGFERSGWMDANYFGCAIGFGIIISLIELLYSKTKSSFLKYTYMFCIIISMVAVVMNASRGALLATLGSSLLLLFLSEVKMRYKVIVVIIGCLIAYLIYLSGAMDFLLFRLTMEESLSDGSGRTDLWALKFGLWFSDSNILHTLFGIGLRDGLTLGVGEFGCDGFHNDYIAIIVEYGIIGAMLFVMCLLQTINGIKNKKAIVFSALVYLLLSSFTLEPLADGYILHFMFLFLIIAMKKSPNTV